MCSLTQSWPLLLSLYTCKLNFINQKHQKINNSVNYVLSCIIEVSYRREAIDTIINYNFPDGLKTDTLLTVPFVYENISEVKVTVNGIILSNEYYTAETKGFLRVLKDIDTPCFITISRLTDISREPSRDGLVKAIEELQDRLALIDSRAESKVAKLEASVSSLIDIGIAASEEKYNLLENKITATKYETVSQAEDLFSEIRQTVGGILEKVSALEQKQRSFERASEMKLGAICSQWEGMFNTLSKDHNILIRASLNRIAELEEKISGYEKRTTVLENKRDVAENRPVTYAAPRMAGVPSVTTALMEASLNGIRSALNTETQVRRREDAQIKALLKRLLGKYERLEDWIAGESPDFAESVIVGLREEMKRQDDILGRIHLENIVRINELREKHINV